MKLLAWAALVTATAAAQHSYAENEARLPNATVVYGPYFSRNGTARRTECNTYYLYLPAFSANATSNSSGPPFVPPPHNATNSSNTPVVPPFANATNATNSSDTPVVPPIIPPNVTNATNPPFVSPNVTNATANASFVAVDDSRARRLAVVGDQATDGTENGSSTQNLIPVVVFFHGGGFTGGSPGGCDELCEILLANGVAYAAVDYRLVGTAYYRCKNDTFTSEDTWCDDHEVQEAEFIDVDPETGALSLKDSEILANYLPKVGRQEFATQIAFDAAKALEHLLSTRPELDANRVGLAATSAGGLAANYLAWGSEPWAGATLRALVYTDAQFQYPVDNALDATWATWADLVGEDKLVSDYVPFEACTSTIGNGNCVEEAENPAMYDVDLCNATWHETAIAAYCGFERTKNDDDDDFSNNVTNATDFFANDDDDDLVQVTTAFSPNATIGALKQTQVWPDRDSTFRRALLDHLWSPGAAMRKNGASNNDVAIYVKNYRNESTQPNAFAHHALYARAYAQAAKEAKVPHAVYHTDYAGMRNASDVRFSVEDDDGELRVYNYYASDDDFFSVFDDARVAPLDRASVAEQAAFFAVAFGLPSFVVPGGGGRDDDDRDIDDDDLGLHVPKSASTHETPGYVIALAVVGAFLGALVIVVAGMFWLRRRGVELEWPPCPSYMPRWRGFSLLEQSELSAPIHSTTEII